MVQIYIQSQSIDQGVAVYKNSGVIKLDNDTFFPNDDWVEVNDYHILSDTNKNHPGNSIFVFNIDKEIDSSALNSEHFQALDKFDKQLKMFSIKTQLLQGIDDTNLITLNKFLAHELVFSQPFLKSTAYDESKQCYIGLHVDTHEDRQLNDRSNTFQIFSTNLGSGDRYFNFIDLPILNKMEMVDLLDGERCILY